LLRIAPFHFASQQIIDIEKELLAFGLILNVVLGDFDEVANGIYDDLVSRFLNSTFEEEVIGDIRLCFDKLQEGFAHLKVWT